MRYEWDASKARRNFWLKFAAIWLATLTAGAIPVVIALIR